jgi:hypothetical protein
MNTLSMAIFSPGLRTSVADIAAGRKDIIHLRCPHFCQDGERLVGAAIRDGLQKRRTAE